MSGRLNTSSYPVYVTGGAPQVNLYSAGSWNWTPVSNNYYFAYWVVATTDYDNPVCMVPGQVAGNSNLQSCRDLNTISSVSFGDLPVPEHKVLARVIYRCDTSGAPYYSIIEVADALRRI